MVNTKKIDDHDNEVEEESDEVWSACGKTSQFEVSLTDLYNLKTMGGLSWNCFS